MVVSCSRHSTGSKPSNLVELTPFQNSGLFGPHATAACTPNAFSHRTATVPSCGLTLFRTLFMASCWRQLGVVEYEAPESCGEELNTLNHCAIEPGTMTRWPGMRPSTHLAIRYSIVGRMSTGRVACAAKARRPGRCSANTHTQNTARAIPILRGSLAHSQAP